MQTYPYFDELQFRDGEMIVEVKFPGYGVLYEPAFSTDISETCVWMSPYWMEPPDDRDLL